MRLLTLNRQELIYLLLRPQHVCDCVCDFSRKFMSQYTCMSVSMCVCVSNERTRVLRSRVHATFMHEFITHRAYGNSQIDAICFVACARLRLIYKQSFETWSDQKRHAFFSHTLPLPFGVGVTVTVCVCVWVFVVKIVRNVQNK